MGLAEDNYCVTRKEILAVINFVKYYKHYLLGKEFILEIDTSNESLTWLNNSKNRMEKNCHGLQQLRPYGIIFILCTKKMLMQSGLQKEDLKGKTPKKYNKNIAFMKNEMWYSLYEVVY